MPTNIVKTVHDEHLWAKAKKIVKEQYKVSEDSDRFYKLALGVYKKMKSGTPKNTKTNKSIKDIAMGNTSNNGKILTKSIVKTHTRKTPTGKVVTVKEYSTSIKKKTKVSRMNIFRHLVKQSGSKEEFLKKISKMKNVPESVDERFYDVYKNFYKTQMKKIPASTSVKNPESKKKYMEQGRIIHAQVGQRALVMMGANNLGIGQDDNGYGYFSFRIGKNSKGINYVKIQLNAADTYDVEFGKIYKSKYKVISTAKGTHAENLHSTLKHHTGLETSLGMIDKSINTGDSKMNMIKYPALAKAIGLNIDGSKKEVGIDLSKYPALEKSQSKLNKSIEFKISGQKLKDAVDTKISVCKGELAILEKEYPPVPEETKAAISTSEDAPAAEAAAPAPKYNEHWKVRSKKREIDELERCSRNINVKLSYELDKYELSQYGL